MADEEESVEGSEEEEEEESGSEEEEEETGPSEEELRKKQELVNEDIVIIKDIFSYVDETSKRITSLLLIEKEKKEIKAERSTEVAKSGTVIHPRQNHYEDEYEDHDELDWADYAQMNDVQRAKLLEKAVNVLAFDPMSQNNGNSRSKDPRRR